MFIYLNYKKKTKEYVCKRALYSTNVRIPIFVIEIEISRTMHARQLKFELE